MNKKGVFGLTSVQAFFAIILGVALLAYVIVVIMGTLSSTSLIAANPVTVTQVNETTPSVVNSSAIVFLTTGHSHDGAVCSNFVVTNRTSGTLISATNYTAASTCTITFIAPADDAGFNNSYWNVTYNYAYSVSRDDSRNILLNTSQGVSGFFSSINPVYAILAVLVIILVLVVLVRVVTGGNTGGMQRGSSDVI